jgi:hypothetical protein
MPPRPEGEHQQTAPSWQAAALARRGPDNAGMPKGVGPGPASLSGGNRPGCDEAEDLVFVLVSVLRGQRPWYFRALAGWNPESTDV